MGRSHECDYPDDVVVEGGAGCSARSVSGAVPVLTASHFVFDSSRQVHDKVRVAVAQVCACVGGVGGGDGGLLLLALPLLLPQPPP